MGLPNPIDSGLLAAADREHLEREIAAIVRASAALRRAEPELESSVDRRLRPCASHGPFGF